MTPKALHLTHLDSVRGLAALIVFNVHFAAGFAALPIAIKGTPVSILVDGKAAISMFFVLSGIVLSLKAFHGDRPKLEIGGFYIRRFFRISAPFFVALCFAWLAWKVGWVRHDSDPSISKWMFAHWDRVADMTVVDLFRQAALLVPGTAQTLIGPAWTLVIEMEMSVAVPLLIVICRRRSGWLVLFTALTVPALVRIAGFPDAIYLVHFTLGVLIARHYFQWADVSSELHIAIKAGALLTGLLLLTLGNPFLDVQRGFGPEFNLALMALGASIWLVVFSGSSWATLLLDQRPLRFLGRISYSFYICHIPILISVTPLVIVLLNELGIVGRAAFWLSYLTSIALVAIWSHFFFKLVEKPMISVGRNLAQKWSAAGDVPEGVDLRN